MKELTKMMIKMLRTAAIISGLKTKIYASIIFIFVVLSTAIYIQYLKIQNLNYKIDLLNQEMKQLKIEQKLTEENMNTLVKQTNNIIKLEKKLNSISRRINETTDLQSLSEIHNDMVTAFNSYSSIK
jgi:predicted Holliday junction resolvase-like endonuclease